MIAILGDIHFDSSKDYYIKICSEFVSWFASWKYNRPGNELILAGDLVASSLNGGVVIDFLERFYKASQFDHIHIIEGNHDRKFIEGVPQLAYEFLRNKENVSIYRYPEERNIQGLHVLFLPFFTRNEKGKTMREVYSNLYKTHIGPYDLIMDIRQFSHSKDADSFWKSLDDNEVISNYRVNLQLVSTINISEGVFKRELLQGTNRKEVVRSLREIVGLTPASKKFTFGNIRRPRS